METKNNSSSKVKGKIYIVGIGPGDEKMMTNSAVSAIRECDYIVGYAPYIKMLNLEHHQPANIIASGMGQEVIRARKTVQLANEGWKVALISSGDAGVYGMASLLLEVVSTNTSHYSSNFELEIIPGVTSALAASSLLGAPLADDFCTISLSDLLTKWEVIKKRVALAAEADFIICIYNPASSKRRQQIVEVQNIIMQYRPGSTPVGIVNSAYRETQEMFISDLKNFLKFEINMHTTLIIGSSKTYAWDRFMITPRGYDKKYDLMVDVSGDGRVVDPT